MAKVVVLIQRYYDDSADTGDNLSILGLSVFKNVSDAKKFLKNEFKKEKNSGWKKISSSREYIQFYDRENERNYYYFELYEREIKEVK